MSSVSSASVGLPSFVHSAPIKGLLNVEPSSLTVHCVLDSDAFVQLKIKNASVSQCIAWRLKTNRPHRYMVSPKQGILESGAYVSVTVAVNALSSEPSDDSKDKFLIEALAIAESERVTVAELNPLANADSTQSVWKLWAVRCKLHSKKKKQFVVESKTVSCKLQFSSTRVLRDMGASVTISKRPFESGAPNIVDDFYTSEKQSLTAATTHSSDQKPDTASVTRVGDAKAVASLSDDRSVAKKVGGIEEEKKKSDGAILRMRDGMSLKLKSPAIDRAQMGHLAADTPLQKATDSAKIDELKKENGRLMDLMRRVVAQKNEASAMLMSARKERDNALSEIRSLKKGESSAKKSIIADSSDEKDFSETLSDDGNGSGQGLVATRRMDELAANERNKWTLSIAIFQVAFMLCVAVVFYHLGQWQCAPLLDAETSNVTELPTNPLRNKPEL